MSYDIENTLIVITRDNERNIISRTAIIPMPNQLAQALAAARLKLFEYDTAFRTEIHYFKFDAGTSSYDEKPLAVLERDDVKKLKTDDEMDF